MQQVADAAGVSLTAVSHILGQRAGAGYASHTITQVKAVSKRLGFRPNAAAKAISSGRFSSILLLQDAIPERTFLSPLFVLSLSARLAAAGYRLTVATIDDHEVPGRVAEVLEHIHADAVVANYHTDLPTTLRKTLDRAKLPVVWVNRRDAAIAVLHDDEAMGRQAADLLLAQGHRRIAYLDPWLQLDRPHPHHSQAARYLGYVKALAKVGLPPDVWTVRAGLDACGTDFLLSYRARLAVAQRPTAVITALPPWTLLEAAAGLGLEVHRDLQVINISDLQLVMDRVVPHVCNDWRALGVAAGELTLASLQGPQGQGQVLVPPMVFAWPLPQSAIQHT